ncbi:hypothetical protein B0H13DRAFT_2051658 [Mycena leptocephala]|nr:hypothetical protein B0H13DRAFT_2051658 [Mycena leptocephala]
MTSSSGAGSMLTLSSLPTELLVAIVGAGQEGRAADSKSTDFKSEWAWSHVSRLFRDVVVGSPELWTLVDVNCDADGSDEILKLYMERSRACLISATLRGSNKGIAYYYKLLAERFSQIVPHMDRIWRLRIVFRTEWGGDVLASFRDVAAPNLQHLEITNEIQDYDDYWITVEMFSSGAPRLGFLKMNGIKLHVQAASQWTTSLTHLEVLGGYHSVDWTNNNFLTAIATQCPLLVHLHLDLSHISPPLERRFDLPALEFLHILVLDGEDEAYLLEMIDLFDTPALTEFIIDGTHGDQIFAIFNTTSFPHSSFPALTSLSFINNDSCTCESDIPFSSTISSPPLALFPALSSLTLGNQCFTRELINDILGPSSQPWPQLETITLCPREDSFDAVGDALRDAGNSKRQHGQPVPAIRLFRALEDLLGNERSRKFCFDFRI